MRGDSFGQAEEILSLDRLHPKIAKVIDFFEKKIYNVNQQVGDNTMATDRGWASYPVTYRAGEMKTLASWIAAGESGSVVGLVGSGRSNLLGFLCQRPDALRQYLPPETGPVVLIPVDFYNLPAHDLSSLYRTILHAFYWVGERFDPPFQQTINEIYLENRAATDPFLPQRALYDLLRLFQEQQVQVVLVLNRFDRFCQVAPPQMINTLRGLRDSFKDTLCFLVGMLQEVIYLPDPTSLGDMYELLDNHVCWVGPMNESDAHFMLARLLHPALTQPPEAELRTMLALSGRFPILLKAVSAWWLTTPDRPAAADWVETLLQEGQIRYRLERMWQGLTQEEQLAVSELQKLQAHLNPAASSKLPQAFQSLAKRAHNPLRRLVAKGLCYQTGPGWQISSELLAAYVGKIEGRVRGRIWLDEKAKLVYQGQEVVEGLTALQYEILRFLVNNPRIKHTHDDIIDNAWPEEEQRAGITPNALQVHMASLRKKLESNPAKPRYFITWHGRPGGYQFFPEGKPE